MKNKEKYFNELVNMFAESRSCDFKNEVLNIKYNDYDCDVCSGKTKHWFEKEYKEPIQLSNDEYVILKNINKDCKWIARDKNEELYLYPMKPHIVSYCGDMWWDLCDPSESEESEFNMYRHLFQFVKWEDEEPYKISKLLEDYEKENENND